MSAQEPVPQLSRHGVLVVAAVIERDGMILIGQRKRGDWNEYKWEFPGGKVETGEDPREALERELREELDIAAEIEHELMRYEHQYPGRPRSSSSSTASRSSPANQSIWSSNPSPGKRRRN